jgi:hypothetical protein
MGMVPSYSPHVFNDNPTKQGVSVRTGEQVKYSSIVGHPFRYAVGNL